MANIFNQQTFFKNKPQKEILKYGNIKIWKYYVRWWLFFLYKVEGTAPSLYQCKQVLRYINLGARAQCRYNYLSFSRSRISVRSFSSTDGVGGAGVSAGFFSFFASLFTTFIKINIQNATMRKSRQVCRKLP